MTTAAWVALALAGVFAAGDWLARARDDRPLEYLCKPAATAALVATAVLLDPVSDGRRAWFVAALVLSLAGDVLLMLPTERFVEGLAAFLLAHVCYVVGFLLDPPAAGALLVAIPVFLVIGLVGRSVIGGVRRSEPALVAPVAGYMGVIAVMVASAAASGIALAAAGAALFAFSDAMIAWNRFVRPFGAAAVAIMVTYHLGQAGLVLSLLR